MGRRVLLLRFGIYRQHPELVRLISNKINNAQPSLLTCAFAPPAKFAYTAGAPDDRAGFRVLHHELLQFAVFVVVQIVRSHAVEFACHSDDCASVRDSERCPVGDFQAPVTGNRVDSTNTNTNLILRLWRTSVKRYTMPWLSTQSSSR